MDTLKMIWFHFICWHFNMFVPVLIASLPQLFVLEYLLVAPRLTFVLWLLFSVIVYFDLDIPHLSFTTLFVSHKLKKSESEAVKLLLNTWLLYLGEYFSHAIEPNGTLMERYSVYSIRSDLKEIFFCSFFQRVQYVAYVKYNAHSTLFLHTIVLTIL